MVPTRDASPNMRTRRSEKKKRAAKKTPASWAVRTHRSTKARTRRKADKGEGVIDLFVSTYESLG
jgi:hypothetical protein